MQFHIDHIVPDPRAHGLLGYLEVIDTLRWGLEQLGHEVSIGTNTIEQGRTNIVLGGQVLSESQIDKFPADTIFYNFEQMAGLSAGQIRPALQAIARKFRVWDYTQVNLEAWERLNPVCKPVPLPVGWAPVLERIPKRADEEIDVLFYGLPSKSRATIFERLCMASLKCIFASGFYGSARDDLIARSKIVLNINRAEHSHIFEVVRVSYLLANGKAVVSDVYPDSYIEPDLREAVMFAPIDGVVAACQKLLGDEPARRGLESRGKSIIQRRDIRTFLKAALDRQ